MSGHSGFMPIGNNMPVPQVNIGGVENVQPGNVNPQVVEGGDAPQEEAPVQTTSAAELARELDILLLQAGKASAKGIDAAALKAQVKDMGLGKKEVKKLNELIENADKTMKALDSFTGRNLATAAMMTLDSGYAWDESLPAGKAIKAALDAQTALSEKFISLINTKGLGDEAKDILEQAALTCDRRSCEIETLVMQFSDAVMAMHGNVNSLDPQVRDKLDTKIADLMGEKSAGMHGNAEALAHMQQSFAPLAKRIDDFAAKPDARLSSETFAAMRQELAAAKNALATLARDGYKVGNSRVIPDKAFMDAAKGIVEQVEARLTEARKRMTEAAINSYVDSVFAPPKSLKMADEKFRPLLGIVFPAVAKLMEAKEKIRLAAREYAKEPTDENLQKLKNAIAMRNGNIDQHDALYKLKCMVDNCYGLLLDDGVEFKQRIASGKGSLPPDVQAKITPQLVKEFADAMKEFYSQGFKGPQPKAFAEFYIVNKTFETQLAHIKDMVKTGERMDDKDFLSSKTFLSAFEGELAPSTLVEVRVHGMGDDDIDVATDQSNVAQSKTLGHGAMNTVFAVTFKNGETKVFKPEAPGRDSLENTYYVQEGYSKSQQIAQLNMATQKTADVLGLGDVMTKTSVGKHDGQYGIFMEKAPGIAIGHFAANRHTGPNALKCSDVQKLMPEEHAKVQGQMMRQCNRLDWFDLITGQCDRHNGNVMVNVGKDGKVVVKGIDNDTCYPAFRIGLNKYIVAGKQLERFKTTLAEVSRLYKGVNPQKALDRLLKDPGVKKNSDGTYTLDASKFEAPELNYCLMYTFGLYSNYVPKVMDEDLYNHLQTLKEGTPERQNYINDLAKRMPGLSVKAAIQRLDDAIRHADELKQRGMVYSEADWNNRDKQTAVVNDPNDQKPKLVSQFGAPLNKNIDCFAKVEDSISQLTQGNYKRNGFINSVKTGWFQ